MLSQKLQDDLMSAYQQVYEAKRGHAAGDSDVEKQASQLASDVKYKAKGKVKEGASEEERKKVFMSILAASPAPNAVKAMARQKLLGEEVVVEMSARETLNKKMKEKKVNTIIKKDAAQDIKTEKKLAKAMMGEERFTDGPEGTKKRLKALAKKRKMSMSKMKDHPQFKTEGKDYGITKGKGPGGAMKKFLDAKAKKLQKEYDAQSDAAKNNPAFQSNKLNPKPVYNSHEPQGEVVNEMGGMKVKSKPKDKNPQNMALPKNVKSGVNYQTMSQSYAPVGNIFNEKKMDPVGQEDGDINNDGKKDGTDKYLASRRKAIGKAIAKKRGKVKEGFSAWRIDLDFNEQVKK